MDRGAWQGYSLWGCKHDLVTKQKQRGKISPQTSGLLPLYCFLEKFPLNANYPACTELLIATMGGKKSRL